jgi:uncharacterized protein (TIGR03435 family)
MGRRVICQPTLSAQTRLFIMRAISLCLLTSAFAGFALGQEFEAVSVKPSNAATNGSSTRSDQGRMTATNVSLKTLIVRAYGVKDYQVEGPDWLTSERFDVVAKFPEALPEDREKYMAAFTSMMQKMLQDRFKLAIHRTQKTFPVYGLVVMKSGIKFKEVPDSNSHSSNSRNTHYEGTCINMVGFADFLGRKMEQAVLDMTGLTAFYDLKLDWAEEGASATAEPQRFPELPIALQEQLGLKLEPRKAPIDVVVVDHIERVPTEN